MLDPKEQTVTLLCKLSPPYDKLSMALTSPPYRLEADESDHIGFARLTDDEIIASIGDK